LTADERSELGSISLPVVTVDLGAVELAAVLGTHNAFGATVVDGIIMSSLHLGEHTGVQLLGPGDLLAQGGDVLPAWLSGSEFRTTAPVVLGLLGSELLAAAYRWPRIIRGLYACIGDQLQRTSAQLVICQLPRVDERVLAMMWLLAESWGQVTPAGVRLPLSLTHETLGALIGARRPTVTLALRKLTADGAIVHQDRGWLLLHPPSEPADNAPRVLSPEVLEISVSSWARTPPERAASYAELRETVQRLREQHSSDRRRTREQLERIRSGRLRMSAIRKRIADEELKRRLPPSS
jgi:CRP-like cAMP-binding protein